MHNNPQNSEILSENEKISIKEMIENDLVSPQKYTVDFSVFWKLLNYSTKQKAELFLVKNYVEKLDFLTDFLTKKSQNKSFGRPEKVIKLTLECAIKFAKNSNTSKSILVYDFMIICKENFEKKPKVYDSKVNYANKALINIQQQDGKHVVSAKELYDFLGYMDYNWSRWYKVNILENPFAVENSDFTSLVLKTSENSKGNFGLDFLITIDFAKKLAMQARTEKGEEARNYFLKCEKELLEIFKNPPTSTSQSQTTQETPNELTSKIQDMSNMFSLFAQNLENNTNLLEKISDEQKKLSNKLENLENETKAIKNFIISSKIQKNAFVLIVTLDKETNYHKIFTKENPVFYKENEKMFFEQSEILFFMDFQNEHQCKMTEMYVSGIFKLQNLCIKEDYFVLKQKHFDLLSNLEVF